MALKTTAVTFGDGAYADVLPGLAQRFEALNNMPVVVLDIAKLPPMPHGGWAKLWMWDLLPDDVERAIWFDADVVPIAPLLDLMPHPDVGFAAVSDLYLGGRQVAEWDCAEAEDLPDYFNTGVFVANRELTPAFEAARGRMDERSWTHHDQTPLNLEVFKALPASRIEQMPRPANWMLPFGNPYGQDIRMFHLAGMQPDSVRFAIIKAFLTCFERLTVEEMAEKGGALCFAGCAP